MQSIVAVDVRTTVSKIKTVIAMKKLILIASCAASISAYALPTYEPFTEFSATIASSGTNMVVQDKNGNSLGTNAIGSIANCLDLCTGGYSAPSGEVWGNLNFSGTAGTNIRGLDVALINNSNIFPASSLANLLPSTFPGFPTGGESPLWLRIPGSLAFGMAPPTPGPPT